LRTPARAKGGRRGGKIGGAQKDKMVILTISLTPLA
jgi:hypothetical protein